MHPISSSSCAYQALLGDPDSESENDIHLDRFQSMLIDERGLSKQEAAEYKELQAEALCLRKDLTLEQGKSLSKAHCLALNERNDTPTPNILHLSSLHALVFAQKSPLSYEQISLLSQHKALLVATSSQDLSFNCLHNLSDLQAYLLYRRSDISTSQAVSLRDDQAFLLSERAINELSLEEAINLSEQEIQNLIQEEDGSDVQEVFVTGDLSSLIENDLDKLLDW